MRQLVSVFAIILAVGSLIPRGAAQAADPLPGLYNSVDHPGNPGLVLTGRGSNSWTGPGGGGGELNAVFNSMSFDGSTLGTQWTYSCGISPAVHTVQDNRVGGVGTIVYTTAFQGGRFWLSRNGPWGDGVNDPTGSILTTTNITTVQYVMIGTVSTPVASRLNINSTGVFDHSNCLLQFVIANGTGAGDTDLIGPKPASFPDFIDLGCAATRSHGSWGYVQDITLQIFCPVPVESSSWGGVKALYR